MKFYLDHFQVFWLDKKIILEKLMQLGHENSIEKKILDNILLKTGRLSSKEVFLEILVIFLIQIYY